MKNLILASLAALSLPACATIDNTPESTQPEQASSSGNIPAKAKPVTAEISDPQGSDQKLGPAAPDYTKETLLYGAMTKFELMTFVEIIRNAGQETVLEKDETITVFAPNNSAFKYAGRPDPSVVAEFLSDHMISGRYDLQSVKAAISEKGGPITFKSVSGKTLTVYQMDGKIKLSGANGVLATITQSDMVHSNGVMHHISDVLVR